ncbi:hypothetical protein AB8R50_24980 [Klebsiella pneumoniae subsp. ozaenae]
MVCVVGRMRDLILQLSKSSIYSTKPFLLCTPMSSNLNNKRIPPQDFVCNLSHARQGVIDSIDTLITNC